MIRLATITRMIKSFLTETISIGGTTQNRFISPKGLYSKPKDEKAIIINLAGGANQDVVMALQNDVELEDGDVYVTDDKSYIHFHFNSGNIDVYSPKSINVKAGESINIEASESIKLKADRIDLN